MEAGSLSNLMQNMTNLIEQSTGSKIELKFDFPQQLPPIMVDTNQIELAGGQCARCDAERRHAEHFR